MTRKKFYYQPSPVFSTIDWCWTFVILLAGICFWLEVTHFQWITMTLFIVFFVVAGLELYNRQIMIYNGYLIIKDMFGRSWDQFDIRNDVHDMTFTRRSIKISKHGHVYQFCVSPKNVNQIKQLVKAACK